MNFDEETAASERAGRSSPARFRPQESTIPTSCQSHGHCRLSCWSSPCGAPTRGRKKQQKGFARGGKKRNRLETSTASGQVLKSNIAVGARCNKSSRQHFSNAKRKKRENRSHKDYGYFCCCCCRNADVVGGCDVVVLRFRCGFFFFLTLHETQQQQTSVNE